MFNYFLPTEKTSWVVNGNNEILTVLKENGN